MRWPRRPPLIRLPGRGVPTIRKGGPPGTARQRGGPVPQHARLRADAGDPARDHRRVKKRLNSGRGTGVIVHRAQTEETRAMRSGRDRPREIALLGDVGSGRTVAAALLVDCLATHWSDGPGAVSSVITKGEKRMNDAIQDLMNCRYPAAAEEGGDATAILIGDPSRTAKYSVELHEMPGEDFAGRLADGGDGAESVLDLVCGEGQVHLASAKKYVIVADCSRIDAWGAGIGRLAAALPRIREARRHVHGINGDVDAPVALLATKTDTLPDERAWQDSVGEILGSYREIMGGPCPGHEAGGVGLFRSHIDTVPYDGSGPPGGQRALGSGDRLISPPFRYNTAEYTGLVSWILGG